MDDGRVREKEEATRLAEVCDDGRGGATGEINADVLESAGAFARAEGDPGGGSAFAGVGRV